MFVEVNVFIGNVLVMVFFVIGDYELIVIVFGGLVGVVDIII